MNFILNHRWSLTDFEQVKNLEVILLTLNSQKLGYFATTLLLQQNC